MRAYVYAASSGPSLVVCLFVFAEKKGGEMVGFEKSLSGFSGCPFPPSSVYGL